MLNFYGTLFRGYFFMQGKKLMPKLRGHKLTKDWKMQEQRSWLFFYHFVLLLLPYSLLPHFPISSRAILIFSRFSSPVVSVAPSFSVLLPGPATVLFWCFSVSVSVTKQESGCGWRRATFGINRQRLANHSYWFWDKFGLIHLNLGKNATTQVYWIRLRTVNKRHIASEEGRGSLCPFY